MSSTIELAFWWSVFIGLAGVLLVWRTLPPLLTAAGLTWIKCRWESTSPKLTDQHFPVSAGTFDQLAALGFETCGSLDVRCWFQFTRLHKRFRYRVFVENKEACIALVWRQRARDFDRFVLVTSFLDRDSIWTGNYHPGSSRPPENDLDQFEVTQDLMRIRLLHRHATGIALQQGRHVDNTPMASHITNTFDQRVSRCRGQPSAANAPEMVVFLVLPVVCVFVAFLLCLEHPWRGSALLAGFVFLLALPELYAAYDERRLRRRAFSLSEDEGLIDHAYRRHDP